MRERTYKLMGNRKCTECFAYTVCSPKVEPDGPECQEMHLALQGKFDPHVVILDYAASAEQVEELLAKEDTLPEHMKEKVRQYYYMRDRLR